MTEEELLEQSSEHNSEADLFEFEDQEAEGLSRSQRRWVTLICLVSFIVFSVVFFPLDVFLRYVLKEALAGSQIHFSSLDLNVFGNDRIESFSLAMPEGRTIEAGFIESGLSKAGLISDDLNGKVSITKPAYSGGGTGLSAASIEMNFALSDALLPASNWNGSADVNVSGVSVEKIPSDIPLPIPLEDIRITSIDLKTNWNNGNVNYNGSRINSNMFLIKIDGTGRVRGQGNTTAVDLSGKVCLRPAGNLEQEHPQIYGFYIFQGGAAGGQLCYNISGPVPGPLRNLSFTKEENSAAPVTEPAPETDE